MSDKLNAIFDFQELTFMKGSSMEIVKFVSFIVRLGLLLALVGQLKFCTLMMMGLASEKSQKGIMSYSKYTKQLTGRDVTASGIKSRAAKKYRSQ